MTVGPDHPRSRGVYTLDEAQAVHSAGSSPLARGLRNGEGADDQPGGIIPARAGFTGFGYSASGRDGDHPRSRGVYALPTGVTFPSMGSSPLARGLLRRGRLHHLQRRIIPARAGFTSAARRKRSPSGGSSPLARGLPQPALQAVGRQGIIPARAGFTGLTQEQIMEVRDHPRSRGVYPSGLRWCAAVRGSSPLARGLRGRGGGGRGRWRIIPARAGFTQSRHARLL